MHRQIKWTLILGAALATLALDTATGWQPMSCPSGTVPVPQTANCLPASPGGGRQARMKIYGHSMIGDIMRDKPDMGAKKMMSLKDGERIEILAVMDTTMNGYRWVRVRMKGKAGYLRGGVMCADANLGGVMQKCQ